jgi:hypothetical protein
MNPHTKETKNPQELNTTIENKLVVNLLDN